MTVPLVSVLLTAFNRESYLAASIESVLAQTWGDFELIVVDDRSTDGTIDIARRYERLDSRVRVVLNERNYGQFANRNHAASLVTAPFLKFHDSDDLMSRNNRRTKNCQVAFHQMQVCATDAAGINSNQHFIIAYYWKRCFRELQRFRVNWRRRM